MNKKEQLFQDSTIILETITGSQLYGTDTPESDLDIEGVIVPPIEYALGLESVGEIDLSIVDKDENNKNTADAIDKKFYDLKKFMHLCIANNPNKIELLYAPDSMIRTRTEEGKLLQDNAYIFLSSDLYNRYRGYAQSQRHKMTIKKENLDQLRKAKTQLEILSLEPKTQGLTMSDIRYNKNKYEVSALTFTKDFLKIGDLNFQYHHKPYTIFKRVKARIDKATNRLQYLDQYGYDVKFGSHLIRILSNGIELLTEEHLTLPLKEDTRKLVSGIKRGQYTMQEVLDIGEDLEAQLDKAIKQTKLPSRSDRDALNKLAISIQESIYYNKSINK